VFKLLVVVAVLVVGAVGYVSTQQATSALPAPAAAAPTAAAGEQRLELTEQALTDRLNQRMAGQPLGDTPLGPASVTHLAAQLKTGQMLASGDAKVGSTSVSVSVTSRLDVQGGRIRVNVQEASAAGVPLPAAVRQSLQQTIQDQVDQEVDRMHVRVTSVTTGDGKLVIVGAPAS
jgi:hypothetical protein